MDAKVIHLLLVCKFCKKIIYSYLNPLRFHTSSIFRTFAASYEGMDNYFVYPRENFNNYIYYVQNQF